MSLLDQVPAGSTSVVEDSMSEPPNPVSGPILGVSRDDALTLLDCGVLVDPRLRRVVGQDRAGNFLPVFPNRIENWFQDEVQSRSEREIVIGILYRSGKSSSGRNQQIETHKIALPLHEVVNFVFRTQDELEAFRDNAETMQLSEDLNRIGIIVDSTRFGSETEDLRSEGIRIPEEQVLGFEKMQRMTSAIAVSVSARRLRRGTSHAMRLLKGLPRRSPPSERDNDTPLFDAILAHRWQNPPRSGDPIEDLIYRWSDVILQDSDLAPASLMDLLLQLENQVRDISDFETFAFEISQEISRIREVVAGLAPLKPLSLAEESTPLVRVLGSLALFVLRRNPVDLLEMPRRDHLATEGVFMLASYWAGLSTRRIRLDKRLCSGAIREVLTTLEVAALTSKSGVLPQAPLAFQISVEDSPRGKPFDLYINKSPIALPFGATWRVEADLTSGKTLPSDDIAIAGIATNPEVLEYFFSDYEVTMSSAEGKVVIRKIPKPAQG